MDRMRLGVTLLLLLCIAAGIASLSCTASNQQTATVAATDQDPVARGRYLTTIMSCGDCHTPGTLYGAPDTTRHLSGSELGWVGPWGVVYARNLTPDSTGLGSWTAEQIVHALRTGNTPDGRQLAPIMPWMNFTNLSDADANAIAAYLKSLPPISHRNLDPVPPGRKPTGALVQFSPPPAWDAPRTGMAGAAPDSAR